jgi:hypothetical protein
MSRILKEEFKKIPPKVGNRYQGDPNCERTGWLTDESATEEMLKCINVARKLLIDSKNPHAATEYVDKINLVKKSITGAYPSFYGLGEWERARVIIESKLDSCIMYDVKEIGDTIMLEETSLWCSGKDISKYDVISSASYLMDDPTTISCSLMIDYGNHLEEEIEKGCADSWFTVLI